MRLGDLDALRDEVDTWGCNDYDKYDFLEAIDNAPTVDLKDIYQEGHYDGHLEGYTKAINEERPQSKWISVDEKLPDEMKQVLVWFEYYRYGDFNCMYQTYGFCYVCDGKWSYFINGETGWRDARIIAWQPLPEPYEKGGAE